MHGATQAPGQKCRRPPFASQALPAMVHISCQHLRAVQTLPLYRQNWLISPFHPAQRSQNGPLDVALSGGQTSLYNEVDDCIQIFS